VPTRNRNLYWTRVLRKYTDTARGCPGASVASREVILTQQGHTGGYPCHKPSGSQHSQGVSRGAQQSLLHNSPPSSSSAALSAFCRSQCEDGCSPNVHDRERQSQTQNQGRNTDAMNSSQPTELPTPAKRRSSRSNSVSSSSVITVRRSTSLKDTVPDSTNIPHRRATPPPPPSRRRSSAAAGTVENIGTLRDGVATLNRWSQSPGSSKSPATEKKGHTQHPSVSRHPNGAALHPSSPSRPAPEPNRSHGAFSSHSPASSPQRRARPRSPAYPPSSPAATPPQLPSLSFLPATVYDPTGSNNASPSETPSTADLFTPGTYTTPNNFDYFNSKPRPPLSAQRPPSRTKADRLLGRSPLGSPPIGVLESEARYTAASGGPRSATGRQPPTAASRDLTQRPPPPPPPPQSAGHERTFSKEQDTRDRSESNASSRLDDGYQGTPPRTRERREKDKKTMLSRALQKANTAVLLDNAQNFEGAIEAYGDACKLLQQVMIRSTGDEDRRKLDSIVSNAIVLKPWYGGC